MTKYPHGLTLNAVCAAIEDYQRHEDSVPEEGILAAFNTLLGHSDIAEALRSMERTADANMAAAQAMRDDMYHWKQRAEAAEAKLAEVLPVVTRLKRRYVCNEGQDLEFIACVTPERSSIGTGGAWDDWRDLAAILHNIEEANK